MHEGEKINKKLCKFFIEIFEFTDEQLVAIDCQIPMTQEIYDSILDRCMELGTAADDLFNRMLLEYPDFMSVYAQKIEDEVNEKYADIDICLLYNKIGSSAFISVWSFLISRYDTSV